MTTRRFAAVDVGSLTVRLAVAERLGPGRYRLLVHRREVTGLGRGLAPDGLLAPEDMHRTLAALKGFLRLIKDHGVEAVRAVGTQALRQAANRQAFLDRLRDELGLQIRVLAPEEEAWLALKGVLSALAPGFLATPAVLVFDVGGGSSEFALLRADHKPRFASLPLGVLTLSQAHPLGDPPLPARVAALKEALAAQLGHFYEQQLKPHLTDPPRLVGTAGAVTTLAALSLKMSNYDPNRVNNMIMTQAQVAELAEMLAGLPEADRARLPGLEPAKAGVMVAGALLVLTIFKTLKQNLLVVIDAGLLEGVLGDMAG